MWKIELLKPKKRALKLAVAMVRKDSFLRFSDGVTRIRVLFPVDEYLSEVVATMNAVKCKNGYVVLNRQDSRFSAMLILADSQQDAQRIIEEELSLLGVQEVQES